MDGLLILMALGGVLWVLISPILFIVHSSRIGSLREDLGKLREELRKRTAASTSRIDQLTEELQQLKARGTAPQQLSTDEPHSELTSESNAPVVTHVTPASPPSISTSDASAVPHVSEPTGEPVVANSASNRRDNIDLLHDFLSKRERTPSDASPPPPPPRKPLPATSAFNEMDASKWMSWVGAIAVMIGMGYFLKYAIDEQWLGPTGRVAIGILGGMLVFVGAALGMKKDYRVLAEGLAGAAMGILYFSLFAAYRWYDLMPQTLAFGGMVLVTALGLSFAARFNSLTTAILSMIGGFLTPYMLSQGGGSVSSLFTYILILDLGVLALATFRNWGALHLLNFFGTALIWLGWLGSSYVSPDLIITAAWVTVFGVVFSLLGIWRHVVRREVSSTADMALMLLTPMAYFAVIFWLTRPEHSQLHGLLAILVAGYYIALGSFAFLRNPGNNQVVVTLVGVGLTFVTLAVPLQLKGHWIVIAWAVESLLLIEIGLRYNKPGFRVTGFGLLSVVQMHLVMYAMGTLTSPLTFSTGFVRRAWEEPLATDAERTFAWGVINGRSMSFLANAIVLAILSWEYRRREKTARIEWSESANKLGLTMPSANQVSLILIPLVPIAVLAMGLLETYVFGARMHWHVETHLSMVPIWLSIFAIVSLMAFRRLQDVPTLGGLARGLYSIIAILFIGFLFLGFPDWSDTVTPLWGWPLLNPRGIGFLMAFVAALLGAGQCLNNESTCTEDRSMAKSLTVGVPFVLLGMCLTETFAFGRRHEWIWASQASAIGIWLSLFVVGILFATRRVPTQRFPLMNFSRLLLIGVCAMVLILFLGTLTEWGQFVRSGITPAWKYPFLNPRGAYYLLAVWAVLVARRFFHPRPTGTTDNDQARTSTLSNDQWGMIAYVIAFLMFTIEVYALGKQHVWGTATSLAITGTWATLAILTIGAGFIRRSAPLRILALTVFALTTAKVFLYDVWYLDRPIRVAAFMGLGVALFVGSFLYRRFSTHLKDWIKPLCLLFGLSIPLSGLQPLHAGEQDSDLSTQLSHRFPLQGKFPPENREGVSAEFVRIPLSQEMYNASWSRLNDLRILSVDEQGNSSQIPYVLVSPSDDPGPPACDLPVIRQKESGTSTEIILSDKDISDAIVRFQLTANSSGREFVHTLRLSGAEQIDAKEWQLIVTEGYIVNRTQNGLRLNDTEIECSPSQFHFYRIEIDHAGQPPLSIKSCTVYHAPRRTATRIVYPVEVKNEVLSEIQTTRAELTLPGSSPVDRLEFTLSGPDEYLRQARLSSVRELETTPIESLLLFHVPQFASGQSITTTFTPQHTRRLRLDIENGDNQRLRVDSARASGVQEYLVVPSRSLSDAKHPVAIYIGGRLAAPSYDLTRIHALPDVDQLATITALSDTRNAHYQDRGPQRAWADEHPRIVWMIVIGGVVVLSAIAAALLKAAGHPQVATESTPANANEHVQS